MRSGNYANYKGVEYKFSSGDNQIILKSNDANDLSKGFHPSIHHKGVYLKTVSANEITEAYSIYTMGTYKGYTFGIRAEENDKYHLEGGYNHDIMVCLDFEMIERGVYRKWVKKNELEEIWEEKTPLLGF